MANYVNHYVIMYVITITEGQLYGGSSSHALGTILMINFSLNLMISCPTFILQSD